MMLFLLTLLTATDGSALGGDSLGGITLEQHFLRPELIWEDLNGDGLRDAWVRDTRQQESLWVLDGAALDEGFQQIPFEPIGLPARPRWTPDGWRAVIYRNGATLEYDLGEGWRILRDFRLETRIRPRMRPIDLGLGQRLLPTFDGYWLIEDDCVLAKFQILPAVSLGSRRMTLTYPSPRARDLNGDGRRDFIAKPLSFRQQGQIRVWRAFATEDGYDAGWSSMSFPDDLEIARTQEGDLDGDGISDLVVLARPRANISIFEEMSFVVYLGTGPGAWSEQPIQVLKTKQNLWQDGPIEVNPKGILFLYYKGFIKARFTQDRFAWHPDGYIEPKPTSKRWSIDEGDRDLFITSYDFNDDGLKDLMLSGEYGPQIYTRSESGPLPFAEDREFRWYPDGMINIDVDGENWRVPADRRLRANRHRGRSSLAMVSHPNGPQFWFFGMNRDTGFWRLQRIK